jgi:hypothetical protein
MNVSRVGFLALALTLLGPVYSRPALIAPTRLTIPPAASTWSEFIQPVIDGDTLMVDAVEYLPSSERRQAVLIFERATNGTWNYAGVLFDGYTNRVHLHGTLAVAVTSDNIAVFERSSQGWARTGTIENGNGYDYPIGVENGAIYMSRYRAFGDTSCVRANWVLRKVNGTWREVSTFGEQNCGDDSVLASDVNGGRAIVVRHTDQLPQPPAEILADAGTAIWPRVGTLNAPPGERFGLRTGSLSNEWAHVYPANLYRNTLASTGGNNWISHGKLLQPDIELEYPSGYARVRGNTLAVQGTEVDYELPTLDSYDVFSEWRTLRIYRPRANGFFDYHAKISIDFSVQSWALSKDGRRVAATSTDNNYFGNANRLYVFDIPDTVTFAGTQQDTFENGNFARWTPTAGQFAVATNGVTRVLRQSSVAGDAGAYLTALDWQDQSIEADLRPLEYSGNDRWFGLVARRVDARNFYYVTLRAPGTISLRRMLDGVVTQLAYEYVQPFTVGRNYRVRLEAVGDQLAVSVDGIPRVHVKDTSFTRGHPGVAGFRTRFEVDNVIVSPATRMLVRFDTPERNWWAAPPAGLSTGEWTQVFDATVNQWVVRQSATTGDARRFSVIPIGNQVISARVRPTGFGTTTGTQDPWIGIAGRVVDDRNYYYLTLRRSNQVSLRRVVNGVVQVIATVPQPLTTGAWHDLRLEFIGTNIRAFVNGDLKIQTTDPTMTGGGRNALLMYKTEANIFSYMAYQP